ncbi:MAG TPA: GntR family transcriptional regulator [Acidimicrobiales bacterium]|jgi:DNA-binding GntR family transcriptional regulator|nr:GntR family transcriptional regulator [Acidimicrobiales bacterium]
MSSGAASNLVTLRASDVAYEQLREMILDLRLAPGEVLNELSLSARIGIGRMPVREALQRLASDRFVVALPRRGTVVSSMTMVDVAHLYEAREAVECGIARVVVRRITDEQIRELRSLVERADEARGVFDAERFLLDDLRIHRFVIGMMDNALLHNAADSLLLHNLRFWRSFFQTRLPQGDTMLSHRDLLAAFENRDGAAAEEATRAHIEGARQLLVTLFDGN